MYKLLINILLILLGIACLVIILPIIIFCDLRLLVIFKINPVFCRNKCLHKLTRNGEELYFLGTLHDFHITSKEYSLLHIKAAIENLMPDLLLVESRQEEMDKGNIADGPPEMLYSNLIASSHGITVMGVDWWSWFDFKIKLTDKERDDNICKNIVEKAPGNKKVLVIMGAAHLLEGIPRLKKQGYIETKLSNEEKDKIFHHLDSEITYPEDTAKYIDIRIEREKSLMDGSIKDERVIERIKKRVKYLERCKNALEEAKI